MKNPYEECPQFEFCNCMVCSLDPLVKDKFRVEGDGKCRAEKPTRNRIGLKYKKLLSYQGLTKREFDGRKRWAALPPAKKALVLQTVQKARNLIKRPIREVFNGG